MIESSYHLFEPTLWLRAAWINVTYMIPADSPPALGLVFDDLDLAMAIFTGWRHRLGPDDRCELLRLAIIEGAMRDIPPGYTVHLGTDAAADHEAVTSGAAITVASCRVATAACPNLRRFKTAFEQHGRYLLVPAFISEGLEVVPPLAMGKAGLALGSVSDVGLVGDPDARLWAR